MCRDQLVRATGVCKQSRSPRATAWLVLSFDRIVVLSSRGSAPRLLTARYLHADVLQRTCKQTTRILVLVRTR